MRGHHLGPLRPQGSAATQLSPSGSFGRRFATSSPGDHLDRAEALSAIGSIAAAVGVPVSADIEGGYAGSAPEVAETVTGLLDLGVVGINIEDGSRPPRELAARIDVARRTADAAGVPLFVNARTDVLLAGIGAPERRLAETLVRAKRYVDAGADGIFVPGVAEADTITTLASELSVPLNVMVGPGSLSVPELGGLGVARAWPARAAADPSFAHLSRTKLTL